MTEHYWGLPTLATFIRWLEELIAILSKPFLMLGFIISTLDLLTQGRLLDIWLIYYGWAAIQAIAVDATFFVVWHKVKKAFTAGHWFQFLGYTILGVALGIVAWAAMDLQSLEQAVGISNAEALARLNLNPVLLTHLRSLVAVIMGAIVAMISPEESKHVDSKKDKKLPGFLAKIAAKWNRKPQGNQPVLPSPVGTKSVEETDKNVPHSEYFAWSVPSVQAAEYQQDFTLIEHAKPEEIETFLGTETERIPVENETVDVLKDATKTRATSSVTITFEDAAILTGYSVSTLKKYAAQKKIKRSKKDENLLLLSSLDGMRNKLKSLPMTELPVVELANGNNHH